MVRKEGLEHSLRHARKPYLRWSRRYRLAPSVPIRPLADPVSYPEGTVPDTTKAPRLPMWETGRRGDPGAAEVLGDGAPGGVR